MRGSAILLAAVLVAAVFAPGLFAGEAGSEGSSPAWGTDPPKAAARAGETGFPVLVYLYAGDCPHCGKMAGRSLADAAVKEVLRSFVLLKIDAREAKSGGENKKFLSDLVARVRASGEKIRGVPALVVADEEWNVVALVEGFIEAGALAGRLAPFAEAARDFRSLRGDVESGKAGYEQLARFLKACFTLKKRSALREYGVKALSMEKGEFHADIAYHVCSAFDPGEPEYTVYRAKALEWDAKNEKGYVDAFCADDAIRILRSIKTRSDRASKLARARKLLEQRLSKPEPKLHPERGQTLYWVLSQVHMEGGPSETRKAREALAKGIALSPDSDLAKTMEARLKDLGG